MLYFTEINNINHLGQSPFHLPSPWGSSAFKFYIIPRFWILRLMIFWFSFLKFLMNFSKILDKWGISRTFTSSEDFPHSPVYFYIRWINSRCQHAHIKFGLDLESLLKAKQILSIIGTWSWWWRKKCRRDKYWILSIWS